MEKTKRIKKSCENCKHSEYLHGLTCADTYYCTFYKMRCNNSQLNVCDDYEKADKQVG